MIDPEKPVQDPREFYGQKTAVRRIFSRIGAGRPQSLAVIGGIKTGKTSLLNYIAHESTRREYLDQSEEYIFCHVDSGRELFHDPASFVGEVQNLLGCNDRGTGSPYAGSRYAENHYNALQKIVEENHGKERKLIFLLDDFHLITSNKNYPLEFFSFLRSLANNYNLAYVTSSFLELQKLCVVKDIEESPFFNIFTNLSLGPLTLQEGLDLLCALTGMQSAALEEILAWCGSFPYIVKSVGRAILESGDDPECIDPEKTLLPVLSPYFEKVLAILPREALNALKSITKDKAPDPREAHVLRPLVKQGFLIENEDGIGAFAPSFTSFLRKNLSKQLLQGRS